MKVLPSKRISEICKNEDITYQTAIVMYLDEVLAEHEVKEVYLGETKMIIPGDFKISGGSGGNTPVKECIACQDNPEFSCGICQRYAKPVKEVSSTKLNPIVKELSTIEELVKEYAYINLDIAQGNYTEEKSNRKQEILHTLKEREKSKIDDEILRGLLKIEKDRYVKEAKRSTVEEILNRFKKGKWMSYEPLKEIVESYLKEL